MRTWFVTGLCLLLLASSSVAQDPPRLARERLVLRTLAGDVGIALYPDVAPQHVAQVFHLARLVVYDTTHFYRVHPGFVAQLLVAEDRLVPISTEQKSAIHHLRSEFSNLKHRRGIVSMACEEGPHSAETSFSILRQVREFGIGAPESWCGGYHVSNKLSAIDGHATFPGGVRRF